MAIRAPDGANKEKNNKKRKQRGQAWPYLTRGLKNWHLFCGWNKYEKQNQ